MDDEPEELEPSAYALSLALLAKGIQPYCVVVDDELHVLACMPDSEASLAQMINTDGSIRDGYMVGVMKVLCDAIEEEALT